MTGYLQRLAIAATAPSRLHPFTAPFHAAPTPQTPVMTSLEDIVSPPPAGPRARQIQTEERPAPAPAEPQIPMPPRNIQMPPPAVRDARQPQRLAAQDMPQTAIPTADASSPPGPFHIETMTNTVAGSDDTPAISANPTLPEIVARLTGTSPRSVPSAVPPPRGTRTEARSPQPTAEPTQVNIHIGRVDVIAVPTPAPRPAASAASAARKPMSLDEYLRRQDGRA